MGTNRPAAIKPVPECLNFRQTCSFWQEIHPIVTFDQPGRNRQEHIPRPRRRSPKSQILNPK
jgi:hypothetical protein